MDKQKTSLRKIVVVFKTHFDFGFTGLPDEVMSLYTGEMFSAVRKVMDSTAGEPEGLRYVWTLPSWPLKYLLHDPDVPTETQRAAHNLVLEGRLHWHAWPFTTHTAFCGLEELVRGFHFSRSLTEEFGRGTIAAKQTDVPGHTWMLPTLLSGAGVKFLHLGVNPGSHAPHVPMLFWWEGPDGSRLLTWYSHGGYGSSLLPPDNWPLDTWLAVLLTVENTGPQSPEELRQIRAFIETNAPGVEVVFGQLDDFANAALARPEQLASLPVVPYDLADTWIHGIGTMPREVARARSLRRKLLELESIAACFDWPGNETMPMLRPSDFPVLRQIGTHIDEAYEQLLLFGEHTWGLDVKSSIKRAFGSNFHLARQTEPYHRLEASWEAKGEYVSRAEAAYARAEAIVRKEWREQSEPANKQQHNEMETLMRFARLHTLEQEPNLQPDPNMLYAESLSLPNVLEDSDLRIEVDPASGGIISMREIASGREWVDNTSPEPFGGYRYDLYSAIDIAEHLRAYGTLFQDWFVQDQGKTGYPEDVPHVTAYARDFQVAHVTDERGEALLLTGGKLRTTGPGEVLLPAQIISIRISPGPTLEYMIRGKEATPLTESTVVPFPIRLPKATFRLGQVGSVIDPTRDIAEGANRNLWCVDWVDVSDDRAGIAIIPLDMPLISIGNTGIYKFEPYRVPHEPTIYAHLSNTQWGTNFPQWLEGDFAFKIDVTPHIGDWRTGRVKGRERRRVAELRDLRLEGELGVCDLSHQLNWSDGLALQSIKPRHDSPGIIVRFWDALGLRRHEIIKIRGIIHKIWRCDLMEYPTEELQTTQVTHSNWDMPAAQILISIDPHAIITLLIEFNTEREM